MNKHEIKNCPRCGAAFECKAGSITQCSCNGLKLQPGLVTQLQDKYGDCLCVSCLTELAGDVLAAVDPSHMA